MSKTENRPEQTLVAIEKTARDILPFVKDERIRDLLREFLFDQGIEEADFRLYYGFVQKEEDNTDLFYEIEEVTKNGITVWVEEGEKLQNDPPSSAILIAGNWSICIDPLTYE